MGRKKVITIAAASLSIAVSAAVVATSLVATNEVKKSICAERPPVVYEILPSSLAPTISMSYVDNLEDGIVAPFALLQQRVNAYQLSFAAIGAAQEIRAINEGLTSGTRLVNQVRKFSTETMASADGLLQRQLPDSIEALRSKETEWAILAVRLSFINSIVDGTDLEEFPDDIKSPYTDKIAAKEAQLAEVSERNLLAAEAWLKDNSQLTSDLKLVSKNIDVLKAFCGFK